jgi:EAL domain-containing protein (putative c-di-GMP-specific phosphodiesterase class I)
MQVADLELMVTGSIGIAVPESDALLGELFRRADAAMYQAKSAGRNRYRFFDQQLHEEQRRRQSMERMLREAVQRNDFEVFYQPVVSMETGVVVSAEALLRWRHPDDGIVEPSEIISVLEQEHLIERVGQHVLDRVCRDLQLLPTRCRVPVAVNLSAAQFESPGLAVWLRERLDGAALEPSLLRLEITESALIRDVARARDTLQQLSVLGVDVAIDDFGTGYSSLLYLRELPVRTLKVDRTFVSGGSGHVDRPIVGAIVQLAHALGCTVVAEGVETTAQLGLMRELGCDYWQGFLCSRPEPFDEFRRRLDAAPA